MENKDLHPECSFRQDFSCTFFNNSLNKNAMRNFLTILGLFCMINLTFAQQTVVQNKHDVQTSPVRIISHHNVLAPAPTVDASISANDITYWVGTGNTEVIFVGNWCSPDVALAWGVRFQGDSTMVQSVMDTIQTYDNRFGYSGMYSTIDEVTYQDGTYNLTMSQPTTGYFMYNVYGTLAILGFSNMYVHQGDLIKVGNTECAISTGDPNDWTTWGYAWETIITPVAPIALPAPPDATISFNEILYWVGEGSNEAVMAVNWADTALAWGYRWNGDATVADMMSGIAAADPRFSYTASGFLDDINYLDSAAGMTTPLGITPGNYWESYNNGFMDMGLTQLLNNGDFEKWADPAAGIIIDSTYEATYGYWWYTRVYPMTITPVTVPDITPSGIGSRETIGVIAYPNPCVGTLHVVGGNANRVELYGVDGRLLEVVDNQGSRITINMQNYPAGLYFLKVGDSIQKILKK